MMLQWLFLIYSTIGLAGAAITLLYFMDKDSEEYHAFREQPIFLLLGLILVMFTWPYAVLQGLRKR